MPGRFEGKTFVITGAAGAIGNAIAQQAFEEGANLVLFDRAQALCAAGSGGQQSLRTIWVEGDARNPAMVEAIANAVEENFGSIDAVIPAAGIYRNIPFSQMSEIAWRETMEINLDAVYRLISACLPLLSNISAIVNVASMAAHRGSPNHAHYAASKGAIISFTRSLAGELAPRTRVNAVSPGIIETPMVSDLLGANGAALLASTPMKRFGTPSDVSDAVLFLASDQASFINGEVLHVNGGLYIN
jgi:3-oxoacyl-[acyl-carrier protein] reductase